ncbi:MAG TPA: HEAT repeat domain-containing protein [Vicinamibacterales bacterium]|nr:HEAT repeat domain-containing protein [Vicinamibacterales bacterium]
MRAAAFVVGCLALSICGSAAPSARIQGGGTGPAPAQGASTAVPRITNGRVVTQSAGSALDATFRRLVAAQPEPAWIGYAVPAVNRTEGRRCCSGDTWISDGIVFTNGRIATCTLESGSPASTRRSPDQPAQLQSPVRLEGPDSVVVLYRVEDKAVQRMRIVSPDCELDAGGRAVTWLEGVTGPDSVRLLSTFVTRADVRSDRLTETALSAIAMHRDDAADAALERFGAPSSPEFVRRKVTFWLGSTRGARGFEAVKKIARDDPSEEVRKSAMFGLSQGADAQAVPELVRFARQDASAKVRGEAIFWLAQKAGQRAAAEITASIENDPDTDVKKRAVFALSQLPKDEGIPLLIKVAKSNQNPAVRKQAMFWLGQSRDPRALDFFAEVLSK